MNPQKVTKHIRFFNVFSARRTFAMGPRMAQALKNQENSMLFTTLYATIKTTLWFCSLFSAHVDDLGRLTGAQNGPGAQKPRKLVVVHYLLCKNQDNSMVLLTF